MSALPLCIKRSGGEECTNLFKNMLAQADPRIPLQHRLSDILFQYRDTPHSIIGLTPAELFLKRAPRTKLTRRKPSLQIKVHERQQREKQHHDGPRPVRHSQLDKYQPVRIRNMRGCKEKWIPKTVTKILGPLTYIVRLPGNNRRTVHVKHMIPRDDPLAESTGECTSQ